jgi:diguanylate cyclase
MESTPSHKQENESIQKQQERMENNIQRLLNFSYIVSHNLRSHTNKIKTIIRLVEYENSIQEKEKLFQELYRVSESLDETMVNLNKVVQINSGINNIIKPLPLHAYIEKAIDFLKEPIQEKAAVINNQIPVDTIVHYNPAYLESILFNFLSNALKYSHPTRNLEVAIQHFQDKEKLVLTISDNGMGIDLEKHGPHLFGMYKTFHGNADAKGLGLFMTKNQVESMNGKIEVNSVVDKGTSFKIWLS